MLVHVRAWILAAAIAVAPAFAVASSDAVQRASDALVGGQPSDALAAVEGVEGDAALLLRAEALRRLGRGAEAAAALEPRARAGAPAAQIRLAELRVEAGRLTDARRLVDGLRGQDLAPALSVELRAILPGEVPARADIDALPPGEARLRLAVRRARRLADRGEATPADFAAAHAELVATPRADAAVDLALAEGRYRLDAGDPEGARQALGATPPAGEPVQRVQWLLLTAELAGGGGEEAWASLPPGASLGLRDAALVVGGEHAARTGEGIARWRRRIEGVDARSDDVAAAYVWLLCADGEAGSARRHLPRAGAARGRALLAIALSRDGSDGLAAATEAEALLPDGDGREATRRRRLDLLLAAGAFDEAEAWLTSLDRPDAVAEVGVARASRALALAAAELTEGRPGAALAALGPEAGDTPDATRVRAEAELARGEARRMADDLEAAQADLRAAADRFDSVETPERSARARYGLALIRSQVEDPAGAASLAEQAARDAAADPTMQGHAWALVARVVFEADPARARDALDRAAGAFERGGAGLAARADVTYKLALLDYRDGDAGAARKRARVARTQARKAGAADLVAGIDELLRRLEAP